MSISPAGPAAHARWLVRLSPIPKLAWMVAGVAFALVTYAPGPLLVVTAASSVLAAASGIGLRFARAIAAFIPLVASIVVLQALAPGFCRPGCEPLASLGPFTVYADGLARGLSLVARLVALQSVAFLVILSTEAPDLFAALDRLRVPRQFSFAASMTLLFVPILRRELDLVLGAQRARGLRASGPAALGRALVPVIVAAVGRVERVVISLETRGFGGTTPRTSRRVVAFGRVEAALAIAGIVAGGAGVAAGLAWWGAGTQPITLAPGPAVAIVVVALLAFAIVIGRAIRLVVRA
ncbi:MAG TPA: energy-coupling factor transporter transmembrane component T [Candidatus Limnocylindrales bacterium]